MVSRFDIEELNAINTTKLQILYSCSAGIDFRRQNLTSTEPRSDSNIQGWPRVERVNNNNIEKYRP